MRTPLVLLLLLTRVAMADLADEERRRGEALAKQGDFAGAIAAFRRADADTPRTVHDCLIGLAFYRWGQLTEAGVHFDACALRASPRDPVPEWLPDLAGQLDATARAAGMARVVLVVDRATPQTRLALLDGPGGVSFAPGAVWLRRGAHTIVRADPGTPTSLHSVMVPMGAEAQVVLLPAAVEPSPPTSSSRATFATVARVGGWTAVGVGLSLMLSGTSINGGLTLIGAGTAVAVAAEVSIRLSARRPAVAVAPVWRPGFAGLALSATLP